MKQHLSQIALILALSFFGFVSCEATDVGNPTPIVIITQPLAGQLDLDALDAATRTIDTTLLLVVATEVNDAFEYEAEVDETGVFTIEVEVEYSYYFDVMYDGEVIGNFRFKQDVEGNYGEELYVETEIEEIDMGCVGFSNGEFSPQNEPFDAYEEHAQEMEQTGQGSGSGSDAEEGYSGEGSDGGAGGSGNGGSGRVLRLIERNSCNEN